MNIENRLLTTNPYSRPQKPIDIKGIVLHWVQNTMTSALFNWNYFEARKEGKLGYGSAHYLIGIDGEIIRAIPDDEMAYHCGAKKYTQYAFEKFGSYPNGKTIGIELCHIDDLGKMSKETWKSMIDLCAMLCKQYQLNPYRDITTHMAIVGTEKKKCPLYFFNNPDAFQLAQMKVEEAM